MLLRIDGVGSLLQCSTRDAAANLYTVYPRFDSIVCCRPNVAGCYEMPLHQQTPGSSPLLWNQHRSQAAALHVSTHDNEVQAASAMHLPKDLFAASCSLAAIISSTQVVEGHSIQAAIKLRECPQLQCQPSDVQPRSRLRR